MLTKSNSKTDYLLIVLFGILIIFGLIMLSSASSPVGKNSFDDNYFYIKRQIFYGFLPGLFFFFIFSKIDYHIWYKMSKLILAGSVVLLLLVFVPGLGSTLNTFAKSWLVVGGYTLQPSEFVKLGLIMFMSAYLAKRKNDMPDFKKGFLPAIILGLSPIFLVGIQPDLGTSAIMFLILLGLLFLANTNIYHIMILFLVGVSVVGVIFFAFPSRAKRLTESFTVFLRPELDSQGIGYQTSQAFVAIGSGGFFGLGLGHSRQKFQYLPEVQADSIYAIIAEEMGFLFAAGLVVLLAFICLRGFKIAKNAPDDFGRLLVGGIIVWFIVQSFLNIGAMVGVLPLTGVPLPFISHGGTALLIGMISIGIVVNVSKQTGRN